MQQRNSAVMILSSTQRSGGYCTGATVHPTIIQGPLSLLLPRSEHAHFVGLLDTGQLPLQACSIPFNLV